MAVRETTRVNSVGRLMLRPMRAVATPTLERAIDGVLSGPLPEAVAESLVEHRVAQRIADVLLERIDVDQAAASALESARTEQVLRQVLASPALERMLRTPEFEQLLGQVLASPQVRAALTQQTTSLATETVASVRRRAVGLDDAAERGPRRWLRRAPRREVARDASSPYAGVATRGTALAIDAGLVSLVFLIGAALVGLVSSLVGELRPAWLVGTLGAAAWLILLIVYFGGFWTATGQTPGMRLLHLRVLDRSGRAPKLGRSLVRFVGLALAIIPCFAGFLPALIDNSRRALQDFLAGTVVVYDAQEPRS
jgi:uncharacterized RDD family membrane protein YckC